MKTPPSITLDPGHGGKDPGAVGLRGHREKDIALAVTTRMARMLAAAGVAVKQTRIDDRFPELAERANMANAFETDLFLSVHCNSADRRDAKGYEVFTTRGQNASDAFGTALFDAWAKSFPSRVARTDLADGDADKEAGFAVLRLTEMPAALFELDFISNPEVEQWLAAELNQIAMAEALSDGVLKHLGMLPGKAAVPVPVPVQPVAPANPMKDKLLEMAAELVTLANRL